ncbi:winged helix-turn-helix domain-containing protein [Kutzneria sp. NPDC052558]|uniref:winged helix-turn-helix domain-containing protein n=1 Tax=Kutzneria sp. NPDC052558 TaxID=3364121 RepID=UPI0037C75B33
MITSVTVRLRGASGKGRRPGLIADERAAVPRGGGGVPRGALIARCWDDPPDENAFHQLITGLRRKLRQPEMIHTVRGEGYRIAPA